MESADIASAELLTAEEALKLLGVSRATFWKLVKRYDLARYQIPTRGKHVYFKREDLLKLQKPVRIEGSDNVKMAA